MNKIRIPNINSDIIRTGRAIISLGCSFVQGHGALHEKIYKEYPWTSHPPPLGIKWNLNTDQKKLLTEEFPDIEISTNEWINFFDHEYNNSFVNVLTKKYFNGEYAAINLGRSGNGNRASIKDLYYYPDILWDKIKELIVIYCPTGPERLDLIEDQYHLLNDHARWKTIWPDPFLSEEPWKSFSYGYKNTMYSEKFEILEQIAIVQELLLWCKYKNAKLIIVPAFMRKYDRNHFYTAIGRNVKRERDGAIIHDNKTTNLNDPEIWKVVDMWPWDNMFYPDDKPTWMDLVMEQEFGDWKQAPYFYTFGGKGTPNFWVSPCCHPSAKGHDLLAKYLYNHLLQN